MDTLQELYNKYIRSLQNDFARGCAGATVRTQQLLAFYQEAAYRLSEQVNDEVTANTLLTYTHNNYD
jgi:hypothetical protein